MAGLGRQALPRLDERAQHKIVKAALIADCEIVINVDARLTPHAVSALKKAGHSRSLLVSGSCREYGAPADATGTL